ncbi:hypothetical protein [Pectobacterium carotovorum]|uniref:hypothetical protein n=1 Tax=Pectobacterium carotovorum TaxID=554 RepID=UPI0013158DED|nr:hypothetical protein [Pectobacterium carotovorum]
MQHKTVNPSAALQSFYRQYIKRKIFLLLLLGIILVFDEPIRRQHSLYEKIKPLKKAAL